MSRSLWRCRNPDCPAQYGAVLGWVTVDDGLVLDPAVRVFAAYFDTGRAEVTCPQCGTKRDFHGRVLRRS